MSTQITIDESGAQEVQVFEGVPGDQGLPGAGVTGYRALPGVSGDQTQTATPNTLHVADVAAAMVTVLLPAGADVGDQVAVVRTNSAPGSLYDPVVVDADAGVTLRGGPVQLWAEGQAATFFHIGGDVWWLLAGGDLPDGPAAGDNPLTGFAVARRDQNGRLQGPAPADDGDYATQGWVNSRAGVGLRVNGYLGYSPGRAISQSTLLYGNTLSQTADAGSFIPTRDCVAELDLVVHLSTAGSSAGQFRLDVTSVENGTYSIVNTQRFHFHGDVGTKMFVVRGVSNLLNAGQRYWFLLYAGMDPSTAATSCVEVDYQYNERF